MTGMTRRARPWLLAAVTFCVAGSLSAGCALFKPRSAKRAGAVRVATKAETNPRTNTAGAARAAAPVFEEMPAQPQSAAPTVNVFGELDDQPASVAAPTTEAGFQQHTFVDEGHDGDVAVSPDGKWIVFSSTRHNVAGDIYLQRTDGLSVTQLTNDEADDQQPAFSRQGDRIAFCSTRAGTWDVYVMDADGKNVVQVTSGPMHDMHPSFAPDGKRLVYCSTNGRGGQWELWTVDLETNVKRMIGFGLFPSWSPDATHDRIAYQRARARGSRWFSLWTLELVDGEARNVTEIAMSTNAAVVTPVWSPDGKRLAFSTIVEPAKNAAGKPAGQQDVWTINADGTNRRRLTDGKGVNATPFWGAGERVYFVSDRGGTECIWSASAKTSAPAPTMNAAKDGEAQKQDAVGSAHD